MICSFNFLLLNVIFLISPFLDYLKTFYFLDSEGKVAGGGKKW